MRKILSFVISVLSVSILVGVVFAQETELPDPGLTPDSPFYFLEVIVEAIGDFFTFGDLKKAERYIKLATERVVEAKAVIDKGKTKAAQTAIERYQEQLGKALARAEKAQMKGLSVSEITETVAKATAKHLSVLEEVLERVPEQAKPAILRAREVSVTGQAKALENLAKERPERAATLNLQAIRDRLERAKKEAAELDEEGIGRVLADFNTLRTSFEKMGKEKKAVLASLVSENIIEQIEDLDELKDEAENLSPKIVERIKEIKKAAMDGQIEVLRTLASIDPEKAIEINLRTAEARLHRAKAEAEEGDTEETKEAIEEFEIQHKFGEEISQIAQELGKDTTVLEQLVGKATSIHLEILAEVYEKVPEEAKEAIEKAMEVSVKGHEKAVEALKKKEALDEVPEEPPIPEEVPEVVKERVREKVKKELEKEEVEMPKREIPKPEKPEIEKPETEIPETEEETPAETETPEKMETLEEEIPEEIETPGMPQM
jgi:hypothetical protein